MVPALFMFATASVGFGGHPWIAFVGGAFLMIASSAPERVQTLRRYKGEGVADVAIAMLLEIAMNIAGALASAWAGYGLRVYQFLVEHPVVALYTWLAAAASRLTMSITVFLLRPKLRPMRR